MFLGDLLRSSGILAEVGASVDLQAQVRAITADSRKVQAGTVFVAVRGTRKRGIDFVPAALQAGAVAVVVDEALEDPSVPQLKVEDARAAVGPLASALHGHPSRHLRVVGVTGTNGKTTTSVLIAQLLHAAGQRSAAIGTLGIWTPGGTRPGAMTTPDPADLQAMLAGLRDEGVTHVAMEVSSHALDQHRVAGVQFAVTLWTNLSRDHLDYHGTEAAYAQAKARLFRDFQAGHAFVNGDDPLAAKVWEEGRAQAWSLGQTPGAEHQLTDLQVDASGLAGVLRSRDLPDLPLRCPLLGRHNAENLVAAVLAVRALGVSDAVLADAVSHLQAPRGRLEPVPNDLGALVLVDYAHTPDALEKVLAAVRPLVGQKARLITVFGCGGDRDKGKRPAMGRLAAQGADLCVVTSDNPRSEQPEAILAEIEAGLVEAGAKKLLKLLPSTLGDLGGRTAYLLEVDREQAIRRAIHVLQPGDVLLIAGKGHETTQTLGSQVREFDDAAVARQWLVQRRAPTVTPNSQVRQSPSQVQQVPSQLQHGYAFTGVAAQHACGGTLLEPGTRTTQVLCTDSRNLSADALFVALRGERFDGGEFVGQALDLGAAGVVCERNKGTSHLQHARETGAFVLEVDDPLLALGSLTRAYRQRFSPLMVGVTGSNGKTTTKALIAMALSPLGKVLATHGNFNNRIGVPLTLARLDATHDAAVVECGMSEPGEIRTLAAMVQPQVAVVTSIAEAHLQGMKSIEAIAHEKADLLRALPPTGVAIVPTNEPLLAPLVAQLPCRVVRFGGDGDVRLASPVVTEDLEMRFTADVLGTRVAVQLAGVGVHLAHNALAALAVAHAAGVDLQAAADAMAQYVPVGQRMLPSRIGPWLVLEDCYNANPRSTEVALDTLATLPRPHVAILGSMLELGDDTLALHERVGRYAVQTGVDLLVGLGEYTQAYLQGAEAAGMPSDRARLARDPLWASAYVAWMFPGGGTVLVKGSRGARMERVVDELRSQADALLTTGRS